MQPQSQLQRSFLFNVNVVFTSQIIIYGLAFLLRIMLARGLGDEGLGTYSLFYLVVLVAGAIGSLGVGLGNIYFLNKGDYSVGQLFNNSIWIIGATALATIVIVTIYGLATDAEAFVSGRAYWLYAPAVPVTIIYLLLTSFLHGSSRFLALTTVAISQGISAVLIAAALLLTDNLDIFGAILAWTISFALADLLALYFICSRRNLALTIRPHWGALKEQIRYGMQGQLANLAQLFNYRLDQFLVAAFVTRASVGHYAVATSVSESVWWISSAVAMVLLPRLTGLEKEKAQELTPVACRNTLLVSALAAGALMLVAPLLIRILFGDAFDAAVTPLLLLMPGVIAISATRVLGSYLFSQGKAIYNTYTTLIALGATLILDLALIPPLEVNGAAIASSIAYGASLALTLFFYRNVSGQNVWDALVFRMADGRLYLNAVRRLFSSRATIPLRD